MARTPMNEHCSAVILKKFPKKLGDPGKFLIPCEFPGMDECLALADLCASINLMPLSMWKELSLPELTPTCMTLELADRSVSKPIGIAKDVKVKVGMFHFPADFVVVDFEPDPRVLLIIGRCFLKTCRALIDMHKGELTLQIGNEAITYNLDQTSRYSANYDQMTANKIDVTDEACEDDFLLFKEANAFLGLEDDPDSPELDPSYNDPEGDIQMLEAILNSDPAPSLPNHEQSVPSFTNELKACEAKTIKSSVDEPPEVELKDLPPHIEYVFLEGDNKLPVIIAKELGDEEKAALIKEFCTHKILMEEDYKTAVQHQRRVNPKIHDVIKKEVENFLDAGLIYPISKNPWVSPVHCVPKKGGFTAIKNEENELIPTSLVIGWRNEVLKLLNAGLIYPISDSPQIKKNHIHLSIWNVCLPLHALGLCNAPGTFQRCMMAIFHDMIEKTMEVFMDDFSVFGNSFQTYLSHLERMLKRCEDTNLCLSWEKSHFMVKEGIVRGNKISKNGIEVDKAKVDVISKLPHPTTVKGIRRFLGHAGFYRRAENLAADHLSRLENPHQNVLDPKEINESFPLETLNLVSSH
nr:DNA-directed DNA polymerase [Tanacetum cinerariifolium]